LNKVIHSHHQQKEKLLEILKKKTAYVALDFDAELKAFSENANKEV